MIDEILDLICDAIAAAFQFIKEWVVNIIRGIIDFAKNILGFFQGILHNPNTQVPFLANGNKEQFKQMLNNAPKKKVEGLWDKSSTVIEGVYDKEADEITDFQILGADGLDQKTRSVLGQEALVVLD